jgi:hypothetical protein
MLDEAARQPAAFIINTRNSLIVDSSELPA